MDPKNRTMTQIGARLVLGMTVFFSVISGSVPFSSNTAHHQVRAQTSGQSQADDGGDLTVAEKTPDTAIGRAIIDQSTALNQLNAELDRLDRAIERSRNQDGNLSLFREAAEAAQERAARIEARMVPERRGINGQIRRLGPEPKKDDPAEADVLSTERKRLVGLREQVSDIIGTSKIAQERARKLVLLVQDYRRTSFRNSLLERTASPLSPSVWREVSRDAGTRVKQLGFIFQIWWKSIRSDVTLAMALAAFGLGILLIRKVATRMIERYRDRGISLRPDFQGRAVSAFFVFLARAVPPVAVASGLYLAVSWFSDMPDSFAKVAWVAFWAYAIFAVVRALTWTLLATENAEWRVVPLADSAAISVRKVIVAIAGVYAVGLLLHEFIEVIFAPQALKTLLNAAASLALAALLIAFVRTRFTLRGKEAAPANLLEPVWVKLPVFVSAVAIIVATLVGYIYLARFLASQVVVTGSIIALAAFSCAAAGEVAKDIFSLRRLPDQALPGDLSLSEQSRKRWAGVVRWLANAIIVFATAALILMQWGFDWGDMVVWGRQSFFGFEIGAIRISPAAILIGIGLFVLGIFLTRLLQRSLASTLLAPSRLDAGLSHSIRTGVGYAGFALSAILAISYAGFNFTNLAIVAGALSVGIGFGLQSIVNNFVSGLILLAERPIQVGDWIVVGDKEGYVRRISVRATVIETFDRASLIIPNSDLMTAAVTNWTYGNRLGRVVVRVGTSYETDPQFVYETLLDIGRNCTLALTNPPPSVVFEDFADSTLNFSLRIYIADINNIVRAQTELRMDIWKVFKEKDISIDFPQLDVHIKRD